MGLINLWKIRKYAIYVFLRIFVGMCVADKDTVTIAICVPL